MKRICGVLCVAFVSLCPYVHGVCPCTLVMRNTHSLHWSSLLVDGVSGCMRACVHVSCVYVSMCVCVSSVSCMYLSTCVRACLRVCVCVCVCMHSCPVSSLSQNQEKKKKKKKRRRRRHPQQSSVEQDSREVRPVTTACNSGLFPCTLLSGLCCLVTHTHTHTHSIDYCSWCICINCLLSMVFRSDRM